MYKSNIKTTVLLVYEIIKTIRLISERRLTNEIKNLGISYKPS